MIEALKEVDCDAGALCLQKSGTYTLLKWLHAALEEVGEGTSSLAPLLWLIRLPSDLKSLSALPRNNYYAWMHCTCSTP